MHIYSLLLRLSDDIYIFYNHKSLARFDLDGRYLRTADSQGSAALLGLDLWSSSGELRSYQPKTHPSMISLFGKMFKASLSIY